MDKLFVATQSVPGKYYPGPWNKKGRTWFIGREGHWVITDEKAGGMYYRRQVKDVGGSPEGYTPYVNGNGRTVGYVPDGERG